MLLKANKTEDSEAELFFMVQYRHQKSESFIIYAVPLFEA